MRRLAAWIDRHRRSWVLFGAGATLGTAITATVTENWMPVLGCSISTLGLLLMPWPSRDGE